VKTFRFCCGAPLLITIFIFSCLSASAAVDPSVEKRLQQLERAAEEGRENHGTDRSVRSYLDTKLNIGGFSETGINGIFQRYHEPQAAVASTALGINLGAEFSDNLRFSSQFLSVISIPVSNPHDDPRASTPRRSFGAYNLSTLVTQAYAEWEGRQAFRVQGGIGYAPYAISFQKLELVLFVRRGGPQLLRSNSELVHLLWQGLHVHGSFFSRNARWGYNAYTFSPAMNTKMLGVGSRIWLSAARNAVNVGFSTQTSSRNGTNFTTVGPDLRLHWGALTITSELAKSYGPGEQPWSFHVEPDLDVYRQSVLIYVFGDYLESKANRSGTVSDPFKKWEYGAGANWLPTSYTRLRIGGTYNNYVGSYAANAGGGRNYWQLDLSAGVAF